MSKTLAFARRHGLLRLGDCILCRALLRVLQLFFRFDPWHAAAAGACRPYKREAALLAGRTSPVLAVEIGCGLGAIISRVAAPRTVGLDLSPETVAAANFINRGRTRFCVASLFNPEEVARAVGDGPIDVLIMINWVNAFSTSRLAVALEALNERIRVRHLLIDETPPEIGLHSHDPRTLAALGQIIHSWRAPERALHLVRLDPGSVSRTAASST